MVRRMSNQGPPSQPPESGSQFGNTDGARRPGDITPVGRVGGGAGGGGSVRSVRAGRSFQVGQSPEAIFAEVDRLAGTVQDLSVMVEDSLLSVQRARESLALALPGEAVNRSREVLGEVVVGLERLAELAHAALQGPGVAIGSSLLARARPVTLKEAAVHACEVVMPMAKKHGCTIDLEVEAAIEDAAAGPMYAVLLNGVQNAVEAIARGKAGGGKVGGRVCVKISTQEAMARDGRLWCTLEISDDGPGLSQVADGRRYFDLGFTTKREGAGVGLAVARSIVQGLGGVIELKPRENGGALLAATFPVPEEGRAAA